MIYTQNTQTVDMTNIIKVLSSCPNYDEIVNYDFNEGDSMTSCLIDWYRELIFSANPDDERQLKVINMMDKCLALYIKDTKYKKGLKQILTVEEIRTPGLIKEVIKRIVAFTVSYEKKRVFEFSVSKWI